jgi:hypothetical protein
MPRLQKQTYQKVAWAIFTMIVAALVTVAAWVDHSVGLSGHLLETAGVLAMIGAMIGMGFAFIDDL